MANPIVDTAQKSVRASVGAVALVGDHITETFNKFTDRGKVVEQNAQDWFKETTGQVNGNVSEGERLVEANVTKAQDQFEQIREQVFDTFNLPSYTSVQVLNEQIAHLSVQIDDLYDEVLGVAPVVPTVPLTDYDKLNAETIIDQLPQYDEPTLLAIRDYEKAHNNRVTVLRTLERLLVERHALSSTEVETTVEPFPRYDDLSMDNLLNRVADLSEIELLHVQSYEQSHQNRLTVLEAIELRLTEKRSA
ncbi:MAG: phasin family protein [Chloroflexota bacterium]